MTIRQKYQQLGNPLFVKEMLLKSVYNTMHLEGQTVPAEKLEKLYAQVRKEQKTKTEVLTERS